MTSGANTPYGKEGPQPCQMDPEIVKKAIVMRRWDDDPAAQDRMSAASSSSGMVDREESETG